MRDQEGERERETVETTKVLRQFGGAILGKGGRWPNSKTGFRNTHNEGRLTMRFRLLD